MHGLCNLAIQAILKLINLIWFDLIWWTEYKFTCLSVCVSVTLSVNSPTGHTVNGFLQLIAQKTRIYARMCLLGMNNHIYGSKVRRNAHFGGLNRHFKPHMRKIQIAVSSDLCIRLTWNLTGSCGQQQRLLGWSCTVVKQFQDGGRPPFRKLIYRRISAKNYPIFMKFCTQQQILNWVNVTWSKNEKVALDRLRVRQNVFLVCIENSDNIAEGMLNLQAWKYFFIWLNILY